MADAGGGDPRGLNADLAALPPELAKQSISQLTIMLPLEMAIEAIDHMQARGRRLENWEGWVRLRDGNRTKSLNHSGSFALSRDAARAREAATAAMRKAQAAWDRSPEYPNATLYFGLTFGAT